MTTTNDKGELAIAVCPDCNCHSVCDPGWLGIEGETLNMHCDNCCDEMMNPHLIVKFVKVETKTNTNMSRELIALVVMSDDDDSFFIENAPEGDPSKWIERYVNNIDDVEEVGVFVKGNHHAYWKNPGTYIPT